VPRLSLDTNILVYAIDVTHAHKHRQAKELIRRSADADVVLTQQVLGEYLSVGIRRMSEKVAMLRKSAQQFGLLFPMLTTLPSTLLPAFDRAVRYKLQFWDSLIVSVCLDNAVTHLFSEDLQDGQLIDGLMILNPFRSENEHLLETVLSGA